MSEELPPLEHLEAQAREMGGVLAFRYDHDSGDYEPVIASVAGPEAGSGAALHLGEEVYLFQPADLSKLMMDMRVIPDEGDA